MSDIPSHCHCRDDGGTLYNYRYQLDSVLLFCRRCANNDTPHYYRLVGISLIAVVGPTVARQIITDDGVPPFPRCRTHGGLPNNYVVGMLPMSGRQ